MEKKEILSNRNIQKIKDIYESGKSMKEISRRTKVNYYKVISTLKELGIKREKEYGIYNLGREPKNKMLDIRKNDGLINDYKKLTMKDLCNKYNCNPNVIRVCLKEKGKSRDFRAGRKLKRWKLSEEQRKRISERTIEQMKNKEIREKISKSLKGKISMKKDKKYEEIYGKEKAKEIINKIKKARAKQITPTKDTKIEVKIQNFLKQLGIDFFTHQYMKIEHGYQCDILIPSMNLIIECDGDYWHKYPIGRNIDNIRTSELLERGFKVLRLWEFEIKPMTIKQFEEKLERR